MEEKNINSRFENLEDRMLHYRKRPEQSLPKNSYVMVMIDGRSFSQKVKKRFKRPFDSDFISIMNDTCAYLCSQIQGAVCGYVQSDEISIFLTDVQNQEATLFYDGRLVKLLSIIPSIATSYFNKQMMELKTRDLMDVEDIKKEIADAELYQFDCKCWDVPTLNDVVGWYLFRQIDCIRNSKQQAAQTYLPHKQLLGKHTDEQVALLNEKMHIDWNTDFNDGEKYGRIIYKEKEHHRTVIKDKEVEYERSVWKAHYGRDLTVAENREWFLGILKNSGVDASCDSVCRSVGNMLSVISDKAKRIGSDIALISNINEYFPTELPLECEEFDNNDYVSKMRELSADADRLKEECEKYDRARRKPKESAS